MNFSTSSGKRLGAACAFQPVLAPAAAGARIGPLLALTQSCRPCVHRSEVLAAILQYLRGTSELSDAARQLEQSIGAAGIKLADVDRSAARALIHLIFLGLL